MLTLSVLLVYLLELLVQLQDHICHLGVGGVDDWRSFGLRAFLACVALLIRCLRHVKVVLSILGVRKLISIGGIASEFGAVIILEGDA